MFVELWGVGATSSFALPMTLHNICGHLAVDWIPSLPATVSLSFIGWPPFLIETVPVDVAGTQFLALQERAGRSDRQWKGVLSWMLGIAGTRHFLKSDGYRWVAPLSAFYPNAAGPVDLTGWNLAFPPTSVIANRAPGSRSRLRPDYIALRPRTSQGSNSYEWAVAESKGTRQSLSNRTLCPTDWHNQARNISVEINGTPLTVQRHLVVATRINPGARRARNRVIQLRAWNSEDHSTQTALPTGAAVDVVAAHLFGFFRNLQLRENARSLALATHTRTLVRHNASRATQDLERAAARAYDELEERTRRERAREGEERALALFVETDFGTIEVEVSAPTMRLARKLQLSRSDEEAQAALLDADSELNEWSESSMAKSKKPEEVNLSFGVRLLLPSNLVK